MAPPLTQVRDIQLQLTTHLSTPKGWKAESAWLVDHSGRFTHISGHPSDTGRAQDRESSPAKDQRSTAVPRNQPLNRCSMTWHDVTYLCWSRRWNVVVIDSQPCWLEPPLLDPRTAVEHLIDACQRVDADRWAPVLSAVYNTHTQTLYCTTIICALCLSDKS